MKLTKVYKILRRDPVIIAAYKTIGENEARAADALAWHDMTHVARVLKYAARTARLLKLDADTTAAVKIAALLHDIGCVNGGKTGPVPHAIKSFEWAGEYLAKFDIAPDKRDAILAAIREHTNGGTALVGKILAFADKVDLHTTRLTPAGTLVVGNRQFGHFTGTHIDIRNGRLVVAFKTDEHLDHGEIENYPFTKKLLWFIFDLAACCHLPHRITLDGRPWEIE